MSAGGPPPPWLLLPVPLRQLQTGPRLPVRAPSGLGRLLCRYPRMHANSVRATARVTWRRGGVFARK